MRSTSVTGSASPARCSRLPRSRKSANGATRGDTPPSSSASAAAKHCRSSLSVSPPIIAASNSPSGFNARRICASTPGRSLTNCNASADTTRSNASCCNGRTSCGSPRTSRCVKDLRRSASGFRKASPGVQMSAALAKSRFTAASLSAMSSATRSSRKVTGPCLNARLCRDPVDGEGVCAQCWAKLSFIARPFCPRLGIPFVYDPGPELLSMEAIASPPAYARARAAVRYDDVAKTLVHALKYQDRTDLAPAMGRWMARAGQELLNEADWLIPVPLHWRRAWHRRYNQSGALAHAIERQSGIKVRGELLRRVRATEQQVGL